VETEIGPTLREARIRHKIDLTEIEERTKIRVRYLRALENEEWDVLPDPTYTRSFIRTYASFLGLDGERLADDYRRLEEDRTAELVGAREAHSLPPRLARAGGGDRFGPGVIGALVAVALVAVVLVLGLTSNTGKNKTHAGPSADGAKAKQGKHKGTAAKHKPQVSIQLTATAEVWVCALAADGTRVVNGQTLPAGTQEGPFRSGKFDLAFGNGGVDLKVNGKPFQVQNTPSPVGYEVTPKGTHLLQPGTRPDCT
jgi:transcriptional regulator with XRE-family HTH domain